MEPILEAVVEVLPAPAPPATSAASADGGLRARLASAEAELRAANAARAALVEQLSKALNEMSKLRDDRDGCLQKIGALESALLAKQLDAQTAAAGPDAVVQARLEVEFDALKAKLAEAERRAQLAEARVGETMAQQELLALGEESAHRKDAEIASLRMRVADLEVLLMHSAMANGDAGPVLPPEGGYFIRPSTTPGGARTRGPGTPQSKTRPASGLHQHDRKLWEGLAADAEAGAPLAAEAMARLEQAQADRALIVRRLLDAERRLAAALSTPPAGHDAALNGYGPPSPDKHREAGYGTKDALVLRLTLENKRLAERVEELEARAARQAALASEQEARIARLAARAAPDEAPPPAQPAPSAPPAHPEYEALGPPPPPPRPRRAPRCRVGRLCAARRRPGRRRWRRRPPPQRVGEEAKEGERPAGDQPAPATFPGGAPPASAGAGVVGGGEAAPPAGSPEGEPRVAGPAIAEAPVAPVSFPAPAGEAPAAGATGSEQKKPVGPRGLKSAALDLSSWPAELRTEYVKAEEAEEAAGEGGADRLRLMTSARVVRASSPRSASGR
eukprot:tig00021612_g22902.t1